MRWALLAAAARASDGACTCVDPGFTSVAGSGDDKVFKVTLDGNEYEKAGNYGSHCAAHDAPDSAGVHGECAGASPPAWCSSVWCYVDPCTCHKNDMTQTLWYDDYLPTQNGRKKKLVYSYMACAQCSDREESNCLDEHMCKIGTNGCEDNVDADGADPFTKAECAKQAQEGCEQAPHDKSCTFNEDQSPQCRPRGIARKYAAMGCGVYRPPAAPDAPVESGALLGAALLAALLRA